MAAAAVESVADKLRIAPHLDVIEISDIVPEATQTAEWSGVVRYKSGTTFPRPAVIPIEPNAKGEYLVNAIPFCTDSRPLEFAYSNRLVTESDFKEMEAIVNEDNMQLEAEQNAERMEVESAGRRFYPTNKPGTCVLLKGRMHNGASVDVVVTGWMPELIFSGPDVAELQRSAPKLRAFLCKVSAMCGLGFGAADQCRAKFIRRHTFMLFDPDPENMSNPTLSLFLSVRVPTISGVEEMARKKWPNEVKFNQGIRIWVGGSMIVLKNIEFEEKKVSIGTKFCVDVDCSKWFKLKSFTNHSAERDVRIGYSDHYLEVDYADVCKPDSVPPMPSSELTMVSYDLETLSLDPNPIQNEILMVSAIVYKPFGSNPNNIMANVLLVTKECDPIENTLVVICESERELLAAFRDLVTVTLNADGVNGYGTDDFDMPYLLKRAEITAESTFLYTGPLLSDCKEPVERNINSSALGFLHMKRIYHHGIVLDQKVWQVTVPFAKEDSYKLDDIATRFLGVGKAPIDASVHVRDAWVMAMNNHPRASFNMRKIGVYCVIDSVRVAQLDLMQNSSAERYAKADLMWTPTPLVSMSGQQITILNMLFHHSRKRNYILNKMYDVEMVAHDSINGGLVHDPVRGVYKFPMCMDFEGLYPHIIMACNICPSRMIVDKSVADRVRAAGVPVMTMKIPELPKIYPGHEEVWFVQNMSEEENNLCKQAGIPSKLEEEGFHLRERGYHRQLGSIGLLPELELMLKNLRNHAKAMMKQARNENDPVKYRTWDVIQIAVKGAMNSIFGVFGMQADDLTGKSRSFYSIGPLAAAITFAGRQMNRECTVATEERLCEIFQRPGETLEQARLRCLFSVIYGDTDSVFPNPVGFSNPLDLWDKKEEMEHFYNMLFCRVPDHMGPDGKMVKPLLSPIRMEFENMYLRLFMLKPKMYAGLVVLSAGDIHKMNKLVEEHFGSAAAIDPRAFELTDDYKWKVCGQVIGKLKTQGIMLKRRDYPNVSKHVVLKVLTPLLNPFIDFDNTALLTAAIAPIQASVRPIVENTVPLRDYMATQSFKPIFAYSDTILKQSVNIALAIRFGFERRERGSGPKSGDRIQYLFVTKPDTKRLFVYDNYDFLTEEEKEKIVRKPVPGKIKMSKGEVETKAAYARHPYELELDPKLRIGRIHYIEQIRKLLVNYLGPVEKINKILDDAVKEIKEQEYEAENGKKRKRFKEQQQLSLISMFGGGGGGGSGSGSSDSSSGAGAGASAGAGSGSGTVSSASSSGSYPTMEVISDTNRILGPWNARSGILPWRLVSHVDAWDKKNHADIDKIVGLTTDIDHGIDMELANLHTKKKKKQKNSGDGGGGSGSASILSMFSTITK